MRKFIIDTDPVAMGVALWDDFVLDETYCHLHVCLGDEETYGYTINFTDCKGAIRSPEYAKYPKNCTVIKKIDNQMFRKDWLKF